MSDIESIITRESLNFSDVIVFVADIYSVILREITHNASPARSVRSSR